MGLFSENSLKTEMKRRISPTKLILGAFLLIILAGTLLLTLPVATAEGKSTDFITALFTATSATCITGLSVVDTLSYWSGFGEIVILVLIQCGGLGFMVFATIFSIAIRRRISLRERIIMIQTFSVDEISGIVRLAKNIFRRTFIFELLGAMLLSIRFIPKYGIGEGIYKGIFHAVSAFCNAGFDVLGRTSLMEYSGDATVLLTLAVLSIFGGLGFFVWEDMREKKNFRACGLHTKLVLVTTAAIIVLGTALFTLFEYHNPATMGDASFFGKLLASFFQTSTSRTMGFYSFLQSEMTSASKLLTMFIMFVGGSSGSTAGGIKTVTFAVLCLSALSIMRGKEEVTAFGRRISVYAIMKSIAVTIVAVFLCLVGAVIISMTGGIDMFDAVFECVSAFSTTGLSMGITPHLNAVSKIVLIILMYLGRVGLLTLSLGILIGRKKSKITHPEGKTIIG